MSVNKVCICHCDRHSQVAVHSQSEHCHITTIARWQCQLIVQVFVLACRPGLLIMWRSCYISIVLEPFFLHYPFMARREGRVNGIFIKFHSCLLIHSTHCCGFMVHLPQSHMICLSSSPWRYGVLLMTNVIRSAWGANPLIEALLCL